MSDIIATKLMLRVHVGYRYLLLEPTADNFERARWLIEQQEYTTHQDGQETVHVLVARNRTHAELVTVTVCDLTEAEFIEATLPEVVEGLSPVAA